MRTGIILPHQTFTDERGSFTPVAVNYNEEQWDQFIDLFRKYDPLYKGPKGPP